MGTWYSDPEQFKARLEVAGSINKLSAEAGIARSTLQIWKQKHGIVDTPIELQIADEELVKANALLKLENQRLRKNAMKTATGELEADRLIQRLEESIGSWRPDWTPSEVVLPDSNRTAQDLVLEYSDLHAAEVVDPEETLGLNEYNWDIMLDRMEQCKQTVFSHVEHFGFDIDTFHIHMLGDMLSGNIHAELAMTNDRPLAQAVVDLAEAHIPWLLSFAEYFSGSKIKVAGVPGNHPRAWVKPQAKMAHDNADWIFYKMLEVALRGHPQFEFDIPRGAMNTQIIAGKWRTLMLHGDGIRSTMPGVPWGGVNRRIATLEAQFTTAREPIDYFELGHFHTENQLSGIHAKTFMNGSVKGIDEYSLKQFGSGRPAEQQLLTFHPKRGYTGQYAVQLQPVIPASEGWS
jgi:hypothetical protein